MLEIENPPSFVVRTNLEKAASDNGYRLEQEMQYGWMHYRSTTSQGDVWLAGASSQGPWYLSINHPGVIAETKGNYAQITGGPGSMTYVYHTSTELYNALERIYQLGSSLPDVPLQLFQQEIANLPRATEEQRLAIQRKGQDIFRRALLKYWKSACPLTGITDPDLLKASHIIAWADCETDALRLDVHNGFLLSALWDAAFDCGLVSFDNSGCILVSSALSKKAQEELKISDDLKIEGLTDKHKVNLSKHRKKYGFE